MRAWRRSLAGAAWFDDHAVSFDRHYTGSLACIPSRPTLFTGQYPDVHGVTQTDGLGKLADDTRMRWMRPHEVPTLGNWFRAAGAEFESATARREILANHWVVDGNLVTGQNQNAAPMVARLMLEQLRSPSPETGSGSGNEVAERLSESPQVA